MKICIALSSNTEHITAPNSGHFIHLIDFEILKNTINGFFPWLNVLCFKESHLGFPSCT
jgi:hypothetical protein